MNTPSTAFTRPRMWFGVARATIVERMFIENMSTKPLTASASSESRNERESPKTIMLPPKAPTVSNRVRPAWLFIGLRARRIAPISAPTATALRSMPRPNGPTWRIDCAKSGNRATAPPNSTAKRSSEIAPSRIGVLRMNRIPASTPPWLASAADAAVRGGAVTLTISADDTSISTNPST